jgi:hypothetical protein
MRDYSKFRGNQLKIQDT